MSRTSPHSRTIEGLRWVAQWTRTTRSRVVAGPALLAVLAALAGCGTVVAGPPASTAYSSPTPGPVPTLNTVLAELVGPFDTARCGTYQCSLYSHGVATQIFTVSGVATFEVGSMLPGESRRIEGIPMSLVRVGEFSFTVIGTA